MDIQSDHLMVHIEQLLDHPTADAALSAGHQKTVFTHAFRKNDVDE
jgi:hypothetical protein